MKQGYRSVERQSVFTDNFKLDWCAIDFQDAPDAVAVSPGLPELAYRLIEKG